MKYWWCLLGVACWLVGGGWVVVGGGADISMLTNNPGCLQSLN